MEFLLWRARTVKVRLLRSPEGGGCIVRYRNDTAETERVVKKRICGRMAPSLSSSLSSSSKARLSLVFLKFTSSPLSLSFSLASVEGVSMVPSDEVPVVELVEPSGVET